MPSDTQPGEQYARVADGKSAAARDARIHFDLSGLEIALADGSRRWRWPYETLAATEPIRPHSLDVLLSSKTDPGVTVFVPGAPFARELATRAPQLTVKYQRWRQMRPWLIGTGALAALGLFMVVTGWSPSQTIARVLPPSWRERLGTAVINSMTEDRKRCIQAEGLDALEKISERLAHGGNLSDKFKITVIDWSLVNAFAVPGDRIIMTRGLVEKAESADEVAGVLAHEMGHGIELHPETGIIRAVGLSAALQLMMGDTGGTIANMGLMLAQLGYTRAAEHEADLHAVDLLKKSSISNQGLANFFRRVMKDEEGIEDDDEPNATAGEDKEKKRSGRVSSALDLFRTHPPTKERAALIRAQAGYPATPALTDSEWTDLKAVCRSTSSTTQ